MKDTCPICLKPARVALLSGTTTLNVSCKVCGEYRISMPVAVSTELRQYEKRHILSSAVRNRFERNEKVEILKLTDIDSILGISMAGSQVEATAQIFLSYAREDEGKVENLYQELSKVLNDHLQGSYM
jgi:hypothetical protein